MDPMKKKVLLETNTKKYKSKSMDTYKKESYILETQIQTKNTNQRLWIL